MNDLQPTLPGLAAIHEQETVAVDGYTLARLIATVESQGRYVFRTDRISPGGYKALALSKIDPLPLS